MAKPSFKISKTQFRDQYNVVEILTDKSEIMKQLQNFNSKNQAVAIGYKKKPGDDTPEWFKSYAEKTDEKLDLITQEIKGIKTRLNNIETRLTSVEDRLERNHIY